MKGKISEFRIDLLDRLFAGKGNPVYTFVDRDNFSAVDLIMNGSDGEAEGYRLIITKLPPIFDEEEKTADKIAKYIDGF